MTDSDWNLAVAVIADAVQRKYALPADPNMSVSPSAPAVDIFAVVRFIKEMRRK